MRFQRAFLMDDGEKKKKKHENKLKADELFNFEHSRIWSLKQ